ncbi:CRIB domain-containing protein RIC4-like [Lolium rigidum]|uniref:CRIB domain-containing protein RIC4-like n=1 Tax=Lolium rigidum TaxID=89674 RepID=UPI001F5DD135|nr:CRIB domain-containing protein RIC4-like [Lolium rigidum]
MSSREQQPRGRKERSSFIVIPFSSTCRSASSVDVVNSNKPQGAGGAGEVASAGGGGERKPPGKPESLSLVARLLRGFKNLSHQIFAVHDEEDDEDEEQEMVIGLPTDVKHVAHIGWDGSTSTTTSLRSWNRAAPNPQPDAASTSSSSSAPPPSQAQEPALSARQFELAMAAQASAAGAGTSASASTSGNGGTSTAQRRHRHYS